MANKYWVGGTGTWDGGTLDSGFWRTASGGSTVTTAPTSVDLAIFDGNSGGGTVTVVGNMTVSGFNCGAHTGTLDFASSNITCNSTTTVTAAVPHTLKWGSGFHIFKGNLNYGLTVGNLTLDVGTATLNFQPSGQNGGSMIPGLVAHRLLLTGITTGTFTQWNCTGGTTFSVNYFEIDNSNGGPIIFTMNAITMIVNNHMHLAGRPNAPLYFRGVAGVGGISMDTGKSGFIDWYHSHGFTFGSGITLRNGYDGKGNGSIIVPPQATAIGAL